MRKYILIGVIFFYSCSEGILKIIPACPEGETLCNGECVDLLTDPMNCGECGNICENNTYCVAGECTQECPEGFIICDDRCVNPMEDENNCGGCGNRCEDGEICSEGRCVLNCPPGLTNCGGSCVDTSRDPENCGGCGNRCRADQVCNGGRCECPGGLTDCFGECVDTNIDPENCGGCGNRCSSGVCINGQCQQLVSGDDCSNPIVIIPGNKITGDTSNASDNYSYNGKGRGAKDLVFQFSISQTSDIFIHTYWSDFDTVIYISRNCGSGDLGMNDDGTISLCSELQLVNQPPGTYYLVLDGYSSSNFGNFSLLVEVSPSGSLGDSFAHPKVISPYSSEYSETTTGLNNNSSPSCATSSAPDYIFFMPVSDTREGNYTFSLCNNTTWDTVLYIKETSLSSDIACNDDSCNLQSQLNVTLSRGGYFIIVDGFNTNNGSFTLSVTSP